LVYSDRAILHRRIEERFDAMLEAGLIEELKDLRRKFTLTADMPSMRAVGYRQVLEFLDGKIDQRTMRDRGIAATRQLAKRQMTWMRSLPWLFRLDAGGAQGAAVALELLLDQIGKPLGRAGR
jgi:tRNA dimethylallyltransferase